MGIGKYGDFAAYEDQFYGGMYEAAVQNADVFNSAGANALMLVAGNLKGSYNKQAFFDRISGLVSRQDISAVDAADILNMTQGELVGVKCHRLVGPVMMTRKQWKMIGKDPGEAFFLLGQMAGEDMLRNMVNSALTSVAAALTDQEDLIYDATGDTTKTMNYLALTKAMAKMGDAAQNIACFVMHSKPFFDLMGEAIGGYKIDKVAGTTIYEGTIATLGRPCVVTDAACLKVDGEPDTYNTLGLTTGAVVVTESEEKDFNFEDKVSGYKQLMTRMQGEFAFNITIKGCEYDTTQGENPTDLILGSSGTWDKNVASIKNMGGVRLVTQ